MNKQKIHQLLNEWSILIELGIKVSEQKAHQQPGGLSGRINRTIGTPVIFDSNTHQQQLSIQKKLCTELPQWADLIQSQPAIMDGHKWNRKDFIELYYFHYILVIEKIKKITISPSNKENVNE